MIHHVTGKDPKRYRYYSCGKSLKEGRHSCVTKSLPAPEIESVILDDIRRIAHDSGLRGEVWKQASASVELELEELATQRRQLERQLSRDHGEIARLAVLMPDLENIATARIAELQERISRAEQLLGQVRKKVVDAEAGRLTAAEVSAAFENFDKIWNALTSREQTQLVSLLVARIEFDPIETSIAITFHPSAIQTLTEEPVEETT